MSKNILFGNVMATPLSPVTTGNPDADAAILRLQAWPMSPHTPIARPTGKDYDQTVAVAETVGPAKLLELLDDAALETGVSRWSDDHLQSLATGDRRKFKAHYEAVLAALAIRKAYLHWLIGAVCNTPKGLARALEIVRSGPTEAARLVAAASLWLNLVRPEDRRRFADALDLREWDANDHSLERAYRLGVAALAELDPAEVYERYAELLRDGEYGTPNYNRSAALMYGLIAWANRREPEPGEQRFDALDPRWTAAILPMLKSELDNLALLLLERLPADPAVVDGVASRPEAPLFEPESEPVRERPVLVYEKIAAFKPPKLDSLATVTKLYARAFADAGLDVYFDKLAQRAVWLIPKRVDERKLELGGTKLGGHPDLPARAKWPRVEGEPLTFVAQINLREVAPHLARGALPASGLLSFFVANDPNGAAGYCEHARVIYTSGRAKLVRHEVPEDFVDVIYQAATVKLHPTLSLPSPSNRHVTKLLKGDKLARYEQDVFDSPIALPQLLGYRCHGYDAEEPATSQMLLQLTGDDQTQMEFGDLEYLAFFIHQKKLAEREFSKVWPRVGD